MFCVKIHISNHLILRSCRDKTGKSKITSVLLKKLSKKVKASVWLGKEMDPKINNQDKGDFGRTIKQMSPKNHLESNWNVMMIIYVEL